MEAGLAHVNSRRIAPPLRAFRIRHLMAIGMTLDQAVERVTIRPTKVFNFGTELGTLKVGREADITICEVQDGRFEFTAGGTKRVGKQNIVNKAVVRRGKLYVNQL